MIDPQYWKTHYVLNNDAEEIARHLRVRQFPSRHQLFDLVSFETGADAPSVLVSQGSGGHPYVFAELGYEMHRRGYNVFIMPKHGGRTVSQLMDRHRDALDYVIRGYNERVGVYAEGLGGYVAFYLALARHPMKSLVCQNSPAVLTDSDYRAALLQDTGPWAGAVRRRRIMLPIGQLLVHVLPNIRIPIWTYLDWNALIDSHDEVHEVERCLVEDGYLRDPDFDTWYPLSHVVSLVSTPPPNPLSELRTPTMFVVASAGPTPAYIEALYTQLPPVPKQLIHVNGSAYWMLSHPIEAASAVCAWFDATL